MGGILNLDLSCTIAIVQFSIGVIAQLDTTWSGITPGIIAPTKNIETDLYVHVTCCKIVIVQFSIRVLAQLNIMWSDITPRIIAPCDPWPG